MCEIGNLFGRGGPARSRIASGPGQFFALHVLECLGSGVLAVRRRRGKPVGEPTTTPARRRTWYSY